MADARLSAAGAVASAAGAAASWLCCMPLALGALGTVGSGLAHVLGPFRPYISVLSVTLLGVAFYQIYRAPSRACAVDEDCAIPAKVERRRHLLWIAGGVTILFLTLPYWLAWVIYWTL